MTRLSLLVDNQVAHIIRNKIIPSFIFEVMQALRVMVSIRNTNSILHNFFTKNRAIDLLIKRSTKFWFRLDDVKLLVFEEENIFILLEKNA